MTDSPDTMRWVRRGAALAILVFGWVFIAWQNHFHITAPVVFVCLGYLAVIVTIYNLWRTGAAAADSSEDDDDSTWARPAGALGELQREKRTLLKAIKEAEFDHQMGKLSKRDADEMIHGYRARAIEVIKQIDQLGLGAAGTVREQILREVRARVQLEGKAARKAAPEPRGDAKAGAGGKRAPKAGKGAGKDAGKAASDPGKAERAAGAATAPAAAGDQAAAGTANQAAHGASGDAADQAASAPADAAGDKAASTAPAAAAGEAAPRSAPEVPRDDELDADSTTALESRHDDPAKEATP